MPLLILSRVIAVIGLWALATSLVLGSGGQALAEEVTFETSQYYCDKMPGRWMGGGTCAVTADPRGGECDYLRSYEEYVDRVDIELLGDVQNQFCGRRNIKELLGIAQYSRYKAMSFVSMGYDETQCDPKRNPTPGGCNKTWYATYFLHMCAAYLCKYAQ